MAGLCFLVASVLAIAALFALGADQPAWAQSGALVGFLWTLLGLIARQSEARRSAE